jgi:hypothetical protein
MGCSRAPDKETVRDHLTLMANHYLSSTLIDRSHLHPYAAYSQPRSLCIPWSSSWYPFFRVWEKKFLERPFAYDFRFISALYCN